MIQSDLWKHSDSSRSKKARQSKSTGKLIIIPFFDNKSIIYINWVPHGQTVNKDYYVKFLRQFNIVTNHLTDMGNKTVPHPPYNLDCWTMWLLDVSKVEREPLGYKLWECGENDCDKCSGHLRFEGLQEAFQKCLEHYKLHWSWKILLWGKLEFCVDLS